MSDGDAPNLSEDFLGGDITRGLERMRLRLLDLSARNRLLNFRHPKKSSLRVVDELPDQLFGQLIDGKELFFRPVPRPKGIRPPAPRTQGELLDPEERAAAGLRYPSAAEHAATLGIATSFDLPAAPAAEPEPRHRDREIQTLLYPEDLEATLRTIGSAARLAIEETGSNMLYLAFGFLEWYESEDSDQVRVAPLLLLPVTIRRAEPDSQTRSYRYSVSYSGEDVSANITLQERLRKDVGLDLPGLDEDESPESYFNRVGRILQKDSRWRLRRQVTLALLSFGKLVMYRDLDPATWSQSAGPVDHPRVRELFEGIQRSEISFAEDYNLDSAPMKTRVPQLVDEADSSQHSAIVDAIEGKNLVIEGPPGTGKSQTITNLVAAALTRGKTVLFVSEKLAALEVVRHRLEKVGLGMFCLELHSHKAQKRQILDDIDARIKLHGRFRGAFDLESKLRLLEEDKERLTEYAALINRPFGQLGLTFQEIIWRARRARSTLVFDPAPLERVILPNADIARPEHLARIRELAKQFTEHLTAILQGGSSAEHPWYGADNAELTFVDQQVVEDQLRELIGVIDQLIVGIESANSEVGEVWLPEVLRLASAALNAAATLPGNAAGVVESLVPHLRDPGVRRQAEEFLAAVRRGIDVRREIEEICGTVPSIGANALAECRHILASGARAAPGVTTLGAYPAAAETLRAAAAAIDAAMVASQQVSDALGVVAATSSVAAERLVGAVRAIREIGIDDLMLRSQGLEADDALSVLESGARDAKPSRVARQEVRATLDVERLPADAEIAGFERVARESRWWSVLSSDFRKAKAAYVAAVRQPSKLSRAELKSGYARIMKWRAADRQFRSAKRLAEICGGAYAGIDTDFDALIRLVKWRRAVRERLSSHGLDGLRVADAAWKAPVDAARNLRDSEGSAFGLTTPMKHAIDAFSAAEAVGAADPSMDWRAAKPALTAAAVELDGILPALERIGFPAQLAISDAHRLIQRLTDLETLRATIENAGDLPRILGPAFAGLETNLEQIANTISFVESVQNASAPAAAKSWLLRDAPVQRAPRLAELVGGTTALINTVVTKWTKFAELLRIDEGRWFAPGETIQSWPTRRVAERLERAASNLSLLPGWLDFIRARSALGEHHLESIGVLAESGRLRAADLDAAASFIFWNSLIHAGFRQHPVLARFSGLSHDQIRARFAAIDRECIELFRDRAAVEIDQRQIPYGVGRGPASAFTELHLLEREIGKQRGHIPVRQLMRRAGRALQALKPCFMMGPLSVSQYLPAGLLTFDMIIMDEASQLKPEDALAAIARGTQIVIVGDRQQLPPTSFFDRLGEDEDVDDTQKDAIEEAESILDVASAVHRPARLLRWHYRSRHGSLIAFSNKEFYRNDLVVFPSPVPKSATLGVKLVHVKDGVYASSRNVTEARRVVDTALRHMAERPEESLGIVTLNASQQELVEDIFEQRLKTDPVAQEYVERRSAGLEPFFIKNLENVQGDERDVIYISVTYGRSSDGHVYQRFGPINGPTGHRRLNVLFTRARKRVVVFASMTADDIVVQPSSSRGVRALKGYLEYARSGVLDQAQFTGREPDSDFEVEVAEALRAHGFEVVAQVGVSGYFIDLAVGHPKRADAFILGIECDGRAYHSSLSARDRDRLRQAVLEDLDWNIHRIWSTDWFKQPSVEVARIIARIEGILAQEAAITREESPENEHDEVGEFKATADSPNDEGWPGEIALQPIDVETARGQLMELAARIDADSLVAETERLLRKEMIDALIRMKPRNHTEFLTLPIDLRLETNGAQLQTYLSQVLAITSRIAR